VYADWLEERGDVRGEYLRLEHQLAQLREQIDPAWLTAVSCGANSWWCRTAGAKNLGHKLIREMTGLG